jgi:hypothetical protein
MKSSPLFSCTSLFHFLFYYAQQRLKLTRSRRVLYSKDSQMHSFMVRTHFLLSSSLLSSSARSFLCPFLFCFPSHRGISSYWRLCFCHPPNLLVFAHLPIIARPPSSSTIAQTQFLANKSPPGFNESNWRVWRSIFRRN